jgi:ureidoglycolate dehydrogenase (NAD+)
LALMVEILCSLLTGMPFGRHIPPMFPVDSNRREIGHVLIAIDIHRFQALPVFKSRLKELLDELRTQPPAPGISRVQAANDPEKENYRIRSKSGIPVSAAELTEFRRVASMLELNIGKLG